MPTPQKRPSTRHYLQTTSDNRRSAWCMHDADGRPRPSISGRSERNRGRDGLFHPVRRRPAGVLSPDRCVGYSPACSVVHASRDLQTRPQVTVFIHLIWRRTILSSVKRSGNWAELRSDRCWREAVCVICRHWAAVHRGRSASNLPLSAARRRRTGLCTDQRKAASATSVRCRHC